MVSERWTWLLVSLLSTSCSTTRPTVEARDGSPTDSSDGSSAGDGGGSIKDGGVGLDAGVEADTGAGGDKDADVLPRGDGTQGVACSAGGECQSGLCYKAKCTHPDIVEVRQVQAEPNPGGKGWMDSYSYQGKCYCKSNGYDHGIGDFQYEVNGQILRVEDICEKLVGKGPIKDPAAAGRPIYNDVQCGNGPANTSHDETTCPGRVDIGPDGCGQIGPKWDL